MHNARQTTPFKREVKGERRPMSRPPKPKAWSHQDELAALKGKRIAFDMADEGGTSVVGTLLEADAFTVKVDVHAVAGVDGSAGVVTVFKHAIAAFYGERK